MATQAIWSGTISFSLVAIPVQLIRATRPGRISFRLLHQKDYSPLSRKMVCPAEEKIIPPEEMIRGFEIGPDKYILITERELESLTPERSRTIEISEFIDLKDMDSIYYDHPYYLIPAKGGEKAYRLLTEVMHKTNKAGLAKFILGEREYPVAVKSTGKALSLITLHYSTEILSVRAITPQEIKIDSAEKNSLTGIIKKMITGFTPDKYADDRRKKIMKLIGKKTKKLKPVAAPIVEEEEEGPPDLIAVLQESMRKVREKR